jgi:ubiquinone/menaquinone biosynthesis C-methylase UbiE
MKEFTRHDYTEHHLQKYLRFYRSGRRKIKIKIVSRLLGDIEGKSVLDIGIGEGFFSRLCIQKKARTISLDFADPMIQYHRENNPDFTLVQADAQYLPFKTESFDTILALDVIEHLPSPPDFLNEVNRVLKTGGRLILTTPNTGNIIEETLKMPFRVLSKVFPFEMREKDADHCTHIKEFSVRELRALLKTSNFKIRKFDTFNENILYKTLDPVFSHSLPFLKAYKWRNAYFMLEKEG